MNKGTYFIDYCRDRRAWLLLYLLTVGIFLIVCSLSQMQNFRQLLYAFLLSLFFWSCYCIYDYTGYVKKRRRLLLAVENPEQAAELLSEDALSENRHICEKYQINQKTGREVGIYTFSLGKFMPGEVYTFDGVDSLKVLRVIQENSGGHINEDSFIKKLNKWFNS